MHTVTFYPKNNPSLEEVQRFVQSSPEGDWVAESRGVIESEDGRVYLDHDDRYREYHDKYLDDQERTELTARLGFSPTPALHVYASHAYQHSRELARSVCEQLEKRWGGGWSE